MIFDLRRTDGGTFFSRAGALLDMGWSEADVIAEIAAQEKRAEKRNKKRWLRMDAERDARRELRAYDKKYWGVNLRNELRRRQRIAPIAGYVFNSFLREWYEPSWKNMTLRILYELARRKQTGDVAYDRVTEWRYFYETLDWVRNMIQGKLTRGEISQGQADMFSRILDADPDTRLEGVMLCHAQLLTRREEDVKKAENCFTDARARECLYDKKLGNTFLNDCCREKERIPRFTGKFPWRLWYVVRKNIGAFYWQHWDNCKINWSSKHWLAWIKSCLVTGRRISDLIRIYDAALHKWHGLATDAGTKFEPYGMFSQLYCDAAALPRCNFRTEGAR